VTAAHIRDILWRRWVVTDARVRDIVSVGQVSCDRSLYS